jgi:hypothetical protein
MASMATQVAAGALCTLREYDRAIAESRRAIVCILILPLRTPGLECRCS